MHTLKDFLDRRVPFTEELFEKGDPVLAPVACWEWYRAPEPKEIREQLEAMKRVGFGTVYVLPMPKEFRPCTMTSELEGYLGDGYFERVRDSLAYADGIGLHLWLYDEGGWPSGAACGKVTAARPDFSAMRFCRDESGRAARRPVLNPAGIPLPDIYSHEAALFFTRLTHHAYAEKLGPLSDRVEAMFTDEPAGFEDAAGDAVLSAFEEKYGGRLSEHVGAILAPDENSAGDPDFRRKYFALLGELFRGTLDIFREAGASHGWLSVGHLDRDHTADAHVSKGYGNLLAALKRLDVPGVDAIAGQILSTGNRMDGLGLDFYPRFASSAAVQKGVPIALSESFSVYGAGLTGDEMRYILNAQLVRGIDLFNYMTTPVTVEGWHAYQMRPCFHPSFPGFFALDSLNAEITRECVFMAAGLHAARTALYYPCEEILPGPEHAARAAEAFRKAGDGLEDAGCDFDLIDLDTILSSPVEAGLLKAGGASYARVVIPEGIPVPGEAAEKLRALRGSDPGVVRTGDRRLLSRVNADEDGNLYVAVFNRSRETVAAEVFIDTSLPLCRYEPKTGGILPFRNGGTVSLVSGQCALIRASENSRSAQEETAAGTRIVPVPSGARKTALFRLSEKGASLDPVSGPLPLPSCEGAALDPDFTGEASFDFRFAAGGDRDLLLALDALSAFAEVFLNGTRAGSISTAPYVLRLSKELLKPGENLLTLKIATLAARAYLDSSPGVWFEKKQIGPYHENSLLLERTAAPGGFRGLSLTTL